MNFESLRVRAYLQTGIISDQFLPLDAPLYYHAVRRQMGEQSVSKPGASMVRESGGITLPILKRNMNNRGKWYYACSFAQWPTLVAEDKAFFTKRHRIEFQHLIDFRGRRGKIATKSGRYKPLHVNVYYRHALYVDWYCTADKAELETLLKFVTHLGKKTAQGWGAVLRWEVIEWPEDWYLKGPGGRLMRAVPSRSGQGHLYGIRPSYWNDRHIFPCHIPQS